jgi:hypothetical protein
LAQNNSREFTAFALMNLVLIRCRMMPPREACGYVSSSDDKALFVLDQTRMLYGDAQAAASCVRMHACRTIAASCS